MVLKSKGIIKFSNLNSIAIRKIYCIVVFDGLKLFSEYNILLLLDDNADESILGSFSPKSSNIRIHSATKAIKNNKFNDMVIKFSIKPPFSLF